MKKFNSQSFFSKFPNIDLGNIKLRDLSLNDSERYFMLMSDKLVNEYLSDEDIPKSLNESSEEVRFWGGLFYRKQSVFWAIAESEKQNLIGTIGFNSWNIYNMRAEISYDLMPDYWRKGIMTKTLSNVVSFAFQKMGINRIEAKTMLNNVASQKLLEKIGFKREGILREYRIIREVPSDVLLYSLIQKDCSNLLLS